MPHRALCLNRSRTFRYAAALGLSLALALALTACNAPRKVSGQDPVLALDSMLIEDSQLRVRIRLSNLNDSAQTLEQLSLELELSDFESITSENRLRTITMAARSRESLEFVFPLNSALRRSLQALSNGEVNRMPWSMQLIEDGDRQISVAQGFTFAVPGQAGRFR